MGPRLEAWVLAAFYIKKCNKRNLLSNIRKNKCLLETLQLQLIQKKKPEAQKYLLPTISTICESNKEVCSP